MENDMQKYVLKYSYGNLTVHSRTADSLEALERIAADMLSDSSLRKGALVLREWRRDLDMSHNITDEDRELMSDNWGLAQ